MSARNVSACSAEEALMALGGGTPRGTRVEVTVQVEKETAEAPKVVEQPVNHRPRVAGRAKYGIWNRALPGLIDCFAVRWMRARRRDVAAREEPPQALE